jgi:hypothetical protein
MECRLTSSKNAWSCTISLRAEFDTEGGLLDRVNEIPFGKTIFEKSEVELALRRAQTAILNPHLEFSDLLQVDDAEELTREPFISERTLKFSRNTICIDLEGPELTDLAFVDLPG